MIKIENKEVFGWEAAIRGMRNPMNSWKNSDSGKITLNKDFQTALGCAPVIDFVVGENDLTLMKKLSKAGSDHAKFLRMIMVSMDITAPLYWWKEFDTYKVGTVENSCSTMHKIHEKEFELADFSHEHLLNSYMVHDSVVWDLDVFNSITLFELTLDMLNKLREMYLTTKDKTYWWRMIQLLPSSYNQRRTVMLNYEVLHRMYDARKNHKLDEWRNFCVWMTDNLPYFKELFVDVD